MTGFGLAVVLTASAQPARADRVNVEGTARILTSDPSVQYEPAISGDIIVYTDQRLGNDDIVYWDLKTGTETRVAQSAASERTPDISGDIIVWAEMGEPTGGGDIKGFRIGAGPFTVATLPESAQKKPAVHGSLVVWEDTRDGNQEIYAKDLATGVEKRLTSTPGEDEFEPAVHGTSVVYSRQGGGSFCQLFVTDFVTLATTQITDAETCSRRPDISPKYIVYDGAEGDGNQDIHVFNRATGATTRIVLAGIQRDAHLSGEWLSAEKVAMVPVTNSNVKIYNIPSAYPFEPAISYSSNESGDDIDGQRVVYQTDQRGNLDIGIFEFIVHDDNSAPVADAGGDQEVACQGPGGGLAALDGSRSYDVDGDDLTYHWTGPFADGRTELTGVGPSAILPIGRSTVSLVVNDGAADSAPDTVDIRVKVKATGMVPVLAGALDGEVEPQPEPIPVLPAPPGTAATTTTGAAPAGGGPPVPRFYKAGSTLPLRLRLACGDLPLTGADVAAPRLAAMQRGNGPIEPIADGQADLDPGRSSDGGLAFRYSDGAWIYNFSTRGLPAGVYTIWIETPDGLQRSARFALR
jgi:beta propeller repeat protein